MKILFRYKKINNPTLFTPPFYMIFRDDVKALGHPIQSEEMAKFLVEWLNSVCEHEINDYEDYDDEE